MQQVEIRPDKLSGSISRIVEALSSNNYSDDGKLPHTGLSFLIAFPIAAIVAGAASFVLMSSAPLFVKGLTALIVATPLAIGIGFFVQVYFLWKELGNTVYRITPEGVEIENDYLDQSNKRVGFERITDTEMRKPLILRLFGKGNVRLNSAGSDDYEAELKYIGSPEMVSEQITGMIQNTREVNPSTGQKMDSSTGSMEDLEVLKPDLKSGMVSTFTMTLVLAPLVGIGVGVGTWLEMGEQYAVPAAIGVMALMFPASMIHQYFTLKSTEYRFKQDHLEIYEGFLDVKEESLPYNRITDISLSKPIVQRLFGTGTISINTAGSNAYEGGVSYIKNPEEKHEKLKQILGVKS